MSTHLSYLISSGGIPFLRLLVPGSDVKNPFKEKNSIILLYRVVVFAISGNLEFLYLKKYPRRPDLRAVVFAVSGNLDFLFLEISSYFYGKNVRGPDLQTSLLPCL